MLDTAGGDQVRVEADVATQQRLALLIAAIGQGLAESSGRREGLVAIFVDDVIAANLWLVLDHERSIHREWFIARICWRDYGRDARLAVVLGMVVVLVIEHCSAEGDELEVPSKSACARGVVSKE